MAPRILPALLLELACATESNANDNVLESFAVEVEVEDEDDADAADAAAAVAYERAYAALLEIQRYNPNTELVTRGSTFTAIVGGGEIAAVVSYRTIYGYDIRQQSPDTMFLGRGRNESIWGDWTELTANPQTITLKTAVGSDFM